MQRFWAVLLLPFLLLCGCPSAHKTSFAKDVAHLERLERIPSREFLLTARLINSPGAILTFTLRNIGQRTLLVDTGFVGYPIAHFAFSLELPNHQWLTLYCGRCAPGSLFGQLDPYSIRLSPSQFQPFYLPLSALSASDPHTGDRIDIQGLHGRVLIELSVPAPPNAAKQWPGYISASLSLP